MLRKEASFLIGCGFVCLCSSSCFLAIMKGWYALALLNGFAAALNLYFVVVNIRDSYNKKE